MAEDMARRALDLADDLEEQDTIVFRASQAAVDFLLDKIDAARGLVGGTPTAQPVVGVDVGPSPCGDPNCAPHSANPKPCREYEGTGETDPWCPRCGWHERHHPDWCDQCQKTVELDRHFHCLACGKSSGPLGHAACYGAPASPSVPGTEDHDPKESSDDE